MRSRSLYLSSMKDYSKKNTGALTAHKSVHEVEVVHDNKTNQVYFAKPEFKNDQVAQAEAASQELLRALYPANPETRIALDDKDRPYILSESVKQFKTLHDVCKSKGGMNAVVTKIKSSDADSYKGLGKLMVMALLTNESDLHMNNIGLNNKNEFVRIDGDWAFARLKNHEASGSKYNITESVIQALPFLDSTQFMPYNWFDQMSKRDLNESVPFLTALKDTQNNKLRQEINEGLLACLLLPKEYINIIIEHQELSKEISTTLLVEVMNSRQQLLISATQNKDFQTFMATPSALNVLEESKQNLATYRLVNSGNLLDSGANIDFKLNAGFAVLINAANPKLTDQSRIVATAESNDFKSTSVMNVRRETSFMLAIKSHNINQAKMIFANNQIEDANQVLNQADNRGMTPIMVATATMQEDVYDFLTSKNVSMTERDKEGNNLHAVAASVGNLRALEKMSNLQGIHQSNNVGNSALALAAQEGHSEVVNYLLARGASTELVNLEKYSPLFLAAKSNHVEIVTTLLAHPASNEQLNYTLIASLKNNNDELVKAVFDKCQNTDVVSNDSFKETALTFAASQGQSNMVSFLINKMSVDAINLASADGDTALILAAKTGRLSTISAILSRTGVNKDYMNMTTGETAASEFLKMGDVRKCISLFVLSQNAIVNHKGDTILLAAVRAGNMANINDLMTPANLAVTNHDGENALILAVKSGNISNIEMILKTDLGIINHCNNQGDTALHCAVRAGDPKITQLLIDHKASLTLVNKNDQSALKMIFSENKDEMISLLNIAAAGAGLIYAAPDNLSLNLGAQPSRCTTAYLFNRLTEKKGVLTNQEPTSHASLSESSTETQALSQPSRESLASKSISNSSGSSIKLYKETSSRESESSEEQVVDKTIKPPTPRSGYDGS